MYNFPYFLIFLFNFFGNNFFFIIWGQFSFFINYDYRVKGMNINKYIISKTFQQRKIMLVEFVDGKVVKELYWIFEDVLKWKSLLKNLYRRQTIKITWYWKLKWIKIFGKLRWITKWKWWRQKNSNISRHFERSVYHNLSP